MGARERIELDDGGAVHLPGLVVLLDGPPREEGVGRWKLALLAGALAGASYLTRAAGIALVGAGLLYYALRRRHGHAAAFLAGAMPLVAWWTWWVLTHRTAAPDLVQLAYTDYVGFYRAIFGWKDVPLVAWTNLAGILQGMGNVVLSLGSAPMRGVAGVGLAFGVVRLMKRTGASLYHWFAACYVVLLLLWYVAHGDVFERMLVPLLPLLAAGLWTALEELISGVRTLVGSGDTRRTALAGVLSLVAGIVLVWGGLGTAAMVVQMPALYARKRADLGAEQQAYQWVRSNLPRQAAILSDTDPVIYLYTGRRGCRFVVGGKAFDVRAQSAIAGQYDELADFVRSQRLSHVLVRGTGLPGAEELWLASRRIRMDPRWFRLVYHGRGVFIFEALDALRGPTAAASERQYGPPGPRGAGT